MRVRQFGRLLPRRGLAGALGGVLLMLLAVLPASAHQPFFEDGDFTAQKPGSVKDPTISTALYATLDTRRDVDYVTFEGKRGQSILIGITIPAIDGQEAFTPTVALMGPGLTGAELPRQVVLPKGAGRGAAAMGAVAWEAPPGPASVFFEPFSRTSYWERQEDRVVLPEDGRYTIAVWSDSGATGRYTLVVGDREVFGGDPAFGIKLPAYWTPVPVQAEDADGEASTGESGGCGTR